MCQFLGRVQSFCLSTRRKSNKLLIDHLRENDQKAEVSFEMASFMA